MKTSKEILIRNEKWRKKNRKKVNAWAREWYAENPERYAKVRSVYRKKNKAKASILHSKWYKKNRLKRIAQTKAWRIKNPLRVKLMQAQWKKKNSKKVALRSARWYQKNRLRRQELHAKKVWGDSWSKWLQLSEGKRLLRNLIRKEPKCHN